MKPPFSFGYGSLKQLNTLHPDLIKVMNEAIKTYDFTIVCGHRNQADQEKAFKGGQSKLHWPDSRHNSLPSEAVDCAPYPVDWTDHQEFSVMAGHILSAAVRLGIELEWGGHWTNLVDRPHFQLKK